MDGARLAYLTINNSATPVMEIPHFLGGLYPTNMVFPYPKVKMELSVAKAFACSPSLSSSSTDPPPNTHTLFLAWIFSSECHPCLCAVIAFHQIGMKKKNRSCQNRPRSLNQLMKMGDMLFTSSCTNIQNSAVNWWAPLPQSGLQFPPPSESAQFTL